MFWDLFLKSAERVHTAQMARVRQLRSYSRDCFAPSQETTGEHHAYDLVYLQNVDLGKFSMRARSISPSPRVLALQLNAPHSLHPVSNQTQQRRITTSLPHEKHYNDLTHMLRHDWNNKVSLSFLALPSVLLQILRHHYTDRRRGRPVCHYQVSCNSAPNVTIVNYHFVKQRTVKLVKQESSMTSGCYEPKERQSQIMAKHITVSVWNSAYICTYTWFGSIEFYE